MKTPNEYTALKSALDMLKPISQLPVHVMEAIGFHTGISPSDLRRQVIRIELAVNKNKPTTENENDF